MKLRPSKGTVQFLAALMCAGVMFMLFAFVLSSSVVTLVSGIADLVQSSRTSADNGAASLLACGLVCLAAFCLSVVLAIGLIMKRSWSHFIMIGLTLLLGLVLVIPQPDIATGTSGMREVFSYLFLLGVLQSALYRTCILD